MNLSAIHTRSGMFATPIVHHHSLKQANVWGKGGPNGPTRQRSPVCIWPISTSKQGVAYHKSDRPRVHFQGASSQTRVGGGVATNLGGGHPLPQTRWYQPTGNQQENKSERRKGAKKRRWVWSGQKVTIRKQNIKGVMAGSRMSIWQAFGKRGGALNPAPGWGVPSLTPGRKVSYKNKTTNIVLSKSESALSTKDQGLSGAPAHPSQTFRETLRGFHSNTRKVYNSMLPPLEIRQPRAGGGGSVPPRMSQPRGGGPQVNYLAGRRGCLPSSWV